MLERFLERYRVDREAADARVRLVDERPVRDQQPAPGEVAQVRQVLDLEPVELLLSEVRRVWRPNEQEQNVLVALLRDERVAVGYGPSVTVRASDP